MKKIIATQNAPKAVGPYSQAVQVGNTLYLAGQIAINPKTSKMNHGSIEEQTVQVLNNIKAVLNEAGFSLNDVVQSQVFLTNLDNYKRMNQVYARYFTNQPPARAAVEVSRLPLDAKIEIMVTAVK
ncbi:MAG: hypothetical protein COA86_10315 [Kangiella sp.]|nr:MAG: hypothetical protein COA86_10315 [Kangiella sp.]